MINNKQEVKCLFGFHTFNEVWKGRPEAVGKINEELDVCTVCRLVGRLRVKLSVYPRFSSPGAFAHIINETSEGFHINVPVWGKHMLYASKIENGCIDEFTSSNVPKI